MKYCTIKSICILIFAIILNFYSSTVYGQGINKILEDDFNRQELLLIRNEIRKNLGKRTDSQQIKELTEKLLPWAKMEDFSPRDFSKALVLIAASDDAKIPFESYEEIIPLLPKYRGSTKDFVLMSRFFRESEEAHLPSALRDNLINLGQARSWEGLSTLTAGRLLILSRREKIPSDEFTVTLSKSIPASLSKLSSKDLNRKLNDFDSDLPNQSTNWNKVKGNIKNLQNDKNKTYNTRSLNEFAEMDDVFASIGILEVRERPKLQFTPEELGIGPTSGIESVTTSPVETNSSSGIEGNISDWKILSVNNLATVVRGWIGTKYVYGGGTKKGTDCSGFTIGVLTDPQISVPRNILPRSAASQATIGSAVPKKSLEAGDLVFFSASPNLTKVTHVGLAMGDGKFSHASSSRGVVIQGLQEKWWVDRYVSGRRIFKTTRK
ncbi:C40 family peptidase [Leptospira sp. GIMC2001]|uniref:C40 family peptidase n=1 Tax=Leptospira sp. GIMC2001 TaxID=1513297 RepID=UPI002349ED78|nr:C40 family peptidase [Leptospira sp. GIMC2001]WCL49539.1 C40 family peptidase [Leptospira sp. GIMC2001]